MTPIFADAASFQAVVGDLITLTSEFDYELVAGIDALGFILGAAIAARTDRGFIAIRKGGKLPVATERIEFTDYSGTAKTLEVQRDVAWRDRRILLVDEWIETGAQVRAAASLIARAGAAVAAIATIHCDDNDETRALAAEYRVIALRRGDEPSLA